MDAIVDHVCVRGDQSSAAYTAFATFPPSLSVSPPVARTLPSGSVVRFKKLRAYAMDGVCRQAGDAWAVSRMKVVFEDGPTIWLSAALPAFINLPGPYIFALPPSIMFASTTVQVLPARSRTSVSVAYSVPPI